MPTSAETPRAELLVDTSVAVPVMVADHPHHESVVSQLGERRLGLAGHAAFETYSVMTRLPPPVRRTPAAVARLLASNFPATRYLSPGGADALYGRLAALGVAGGSVYDALVGAAASEHGVALATRDRRALDVYRALEVTVEFLS
ncbi:MAG: type II toxin-antitoxin system VapC family toxin [Acidimicrobiia bacterium]